MKTVYFLGAGASHGSDFQLPLIEGFFDLTLRDFPELSKYIKSTFKELSLEKVNLEEVITQLELSLEGFGALWERPNPELIQAREEFDEYLRMRLQHSSSENPLACECHDRIFRKIESDADSIITLNYDLISDFTLYHICKKENNGEVEHDTILHRSNSMLGRNVPFAGERPTLYYKDKDKGFYLKLHGSIDWVYCPTQTCGHHQLFFANLMGVRALDINPGEPCNLCGAGLVSVVIPPAMGKSFEKFPKMGVIWNLAYRELKEADRWVLIGMSLPESDYYLRWLFREAAIHRKRSPSLIIVNRKAEDIERVKRVLSIEPAETYSTIKEYAGHVASSV